MKLVLPADLVENILLSILLMEIFDTGIGLEALAQFCFFSGWKIRVASTCVMTRISTKQITFLSLKLILEFL